VKLLLVLALLAWPASAAAESGRLADYSAHLLSRTPGTATGLKVHIQFHRADDPDAKPSPIRTAVIALPAGLRYDTTAVPQCMASDDDLHARGSDACPPQTELTVGSLVGTTGFGPPADPLVGDDHVFNGPGELIEVVTFPGQSASPAFDRLKVQGSTLTAHPPMLPGGPPDGETAVRSIDFEIPVRTGVAGQWLITTPPACPAGGRWSSTGTFGFADGSSDTVTSLTPCTRAALPRRMRLSVRPRHVRVGRNVRVRFRVASSARRCVRGARVRFAGRSVRVDGAGRGRMTVPFHTPALRRAVATSPGCAPASAHVRVLPAR
jgi:hypothetical protein